MAPSREVLLIDTDRAHRQKVERPLLQAGYRVESIAHGEALGHISREDMTRYAAVVVSHTDPSATTTSRPRAGEYVVQYIVNLCPDILPRVVLLAAEQRFVSHTSKPYRVITEPLDPAEILAAVRGRTR